MYVSPLDETWKVKWKVQKCWIHDLLLLLNSEASNSTLDHVMTSLTVPEETRPKEISSQTTQMFFIPKSVPCKDHYILWFPHSTPFLVEAIKFIKTVRFLSEYAKPNIERNMTFQTK